MATCVYCLAKTDAQAIRIANRLKTSGFSPSDISILTPDRGGVRDVGHETQRKRPKAPPLVPGPVPCWEVRSVGWRASVP